MPYAVLEKEVERLDETQQNAVVMFVHFLLSQKTHVKAVAGADGKSQKRDFKTPLFGALKDKIKFIAPDFDEPLEDFAEYM